MSGPLIEDRRQVAPADQRRHEVGRVGLTPVVVQRNDVRMIERGDQLRLDLEATDERRVVGNARYGSP